MADTESTQEMPKNARALTFDNVKLKGKMSWEAEPGGPSPTTAMKFILPVDVMDFLFLSASRSVGYQVTITPIKQPLPMDDEGVAQWELPGINVGDVDDDHVHSFVDRLCTCGTREPLDEDHHRHRYNDGRCVCGHPHPTHTFVDRVCVCGAEQPEEGEGDGAAV